MQNVSGVNIQNRNSDSQNNVVSRNFSAVSTTMPNDSTHFTSKLKQKKKNFWQKNWGKIFLSAAAVGIGAIATKGKLWSKPVSFEKVQMNFNKIFGKNMSKEETEIVLKRYKQISDKYKDFRTVDVQKQYISEMFSQVKKDFGYEKKNIQLTIGDKYSAIDHLKHKAMGGGYAENTGKFIITVSPFKSDIFLNIVHEFTHVKQSEIAFRSLSAKELLVKKYTEGVAKKEPDIYAKAPDYIMTEAKKAVNKIFDARRKIHGNLCQFKKGSPEDILGMNYEEAFYNYTSAEKNIRLYKKNHLEQEAHATKPLAKEIFKYIVGM